MCFLIVVLQRNESSTRPVRLDRLLFLLEQYTHIEKWCICGLRKSIHLISKNHKNSFVFYVVCNMRKSDHGRDMCSSMKLITFCENQVVSNP